MVDLLFDLVETAAAVVVEGRVAGEGTSRSRLPGEKLPLHESAEPEALGNCGVNRVGKWSKDFFTTRSASRPYVSPHQFQISPVVLCRKRIEFVQSFFLKK
jgi:hypothetical protein